jgi:ATP-dependent RNA helicase DDX27
MKEVLKGEGSSLSKDGGQVLNRTIPSAVVDLYIRKIAELEQKIASVFSEEKTKKRFEQVEREAEKAENLMAFENEINARPARTWYQSETQKKEIKDISKQKAKEEEIEAQYGRGKVDEVLSAERKLLALAKADDYRSELEKKSGHRLSRKKRRKLEALKSIAEEEAASNKKINLHLAPKRAKNSARETKEKTKEKLISELVKKTTKTGKVIRPKIAVGGIDQDLLGWGSPSGSGLSKKQIKLAQREEFTDFDAEKKLRKGGKIGSNSFKSKKKFKRR